MMSPSDAEWFTRGYKDYYRGFDSLKHSKARSGFLGAKRKDLPFLIDPDNFPIMSFDPLVTVPVMGSKIFNPFMVSEEV